MDTTNWVKANAALREESGSVSYDCRITSFLYSLMRDHVTPGKVEELVREIEEEQVLTERMLETNPSPVLYSNGWLARYAHYLAGRLKK